MNLMVPFGIVFLWGVILGVLIGILVYDRYILRGGK